MANTYNPPIISSAGQLPYGDVAQQVNQFMTNQSVQPFVANLPGYANMVGQRSANTQQMLQGQLPQDVISQITQQAAERGIMGGAPTSPNANAAFLRSLGLNSLSMQQQGSQNLSQAISDTPVPELWNPASLYVPLTLGQQEIAAAKAGQAASKSKPKIWDQSLNQWPIMGARRYIN